MSLVRKLIGEWPTHVALTSESTEVLEIFGGHTIVTPETLKSSAMTRCAFQRPEGRHKSILVKPQEHNTLRVHTVYM